MCGRFTLTKTQDEVIAFIDETFHLKQNQFLEAFQSSYNIAPSQSVITILHDGQGFKGGYLSWGFPIKTASEKISFMANARSETVHEKPTFRQSFRQKRCLILADGFYEWDRQQKPSQPHYFYLQDHQPFCFAGLWTAYLDEHNQKKFALTLLTTASEGTPMAPIHDRLPVVLAPDQYEFWTKSTTSIDELAFLFKPYNAPPWCYHPISRYVNRVTNNDAQCTEVQKK